MKVTREGVDEKKGERVDRGYVVRSQAERMKG
jgi:hypothetical protein